jgi:hypothetical protein
MLHPQAALNRAEDAAWMRRGARLAFYAFVIMLPATQRWVLVDRPVGVLFPEFTSLVLYLSDIPLLVCIVLWLSAQRLAPDRRVQLAPWAATLPASALVALMGLSAAWAAFPRLAGESFVRGAMLLALALFVRNEVNRTTPAATALVLGAAAQAVVALGQFVLQRPLGLEALGELQDAVPRGLMGVWVRGYGLTTHSNLLGGYLVVALVAALGLVVMTTGWRRILAVSAAVLIAAGLGASFSRSAWLGMAVAALALGILTWRGQVAREARRPALVTSALAALVAAVVVFSQPGGFVQRIVAPAAAVIQGGPVAPMEQSSLSARSRQFEIAWREVQRAPLTGVGAANAPLVTWLNTPESERERTWLPVHNVPLLALEELGLLGLVLWLAAMAAPFVLTWRRVRKRAAGRWEIVWLAAFAGLTLISLLDYYPWSGAEGRALWFAVWGLWLAATHAQGEAPRDAAAPQPSATSA